MNATKIREDAMGHIPNPPLVYLPTNQGSDYIRVDPSTAPHDCTVRDCPGRENKRLLQNSLPREDLETLTSEWGVPVAPPEWDKGLDYGLRIALEYAFNTGQESLDYKLALFDELVEALDRFEELAGRAMENYPWPGIWEPVKSILAKAKEVKV